MDQSTVLILHSSGFSDFSGDRSSKRKGIYTADKVRTNSRTEAFWEKYRINLHSKSKPAFPFPTHIFPSRTFWNRDSTLPESLCFARLFSPSPKHELRGHAAAPQQQHPAPAALPAAAGSWWRRRRLLRRLPRLLSSSSPALIVRLCWPRSSVLCPGAIATLFAPWGRSTSPGSGPSLASEESAGYFSHCNKLLKLTEIKCKPQSGLWRTLLLFQKALPFAVTQAVAILGSLLQARGGPSVGSIAFAF